jgi:diaminopimelate decarboxylase
LPALESSDRELRQAVAAGILINVESFREVTELAEDQRPDRWPGACRRARKPGFRAEEFGNEDGRRPKQFGVDAEQVPELLAEIGRAGLSLRASISSPARRT